MNWLSRNLGWLIGTKAHCIKMRDASRPKQQKHESDIDYAKALITYEDKFNRSYRSRAYVKRGLLVLLLIMAITNPGLSGFITYQQQHYNMPADMCHKKRNYFFFSTYAASGHTFVGVFGTYLATNADERPLVHGITKQDSVYLDTTARIDTFKKYPPLEMPALDTGANHNAARMDSTLKENSKPNPFAQPDPGIKF